MLDADTIISYISKMTPIAVGLERRIRFVNDTYRPSCSNITDEDVGSYTSSATSTVPTVSMTVFLLLSLRAH